MLAHVGVISAGSITLPIFAGQILYINPRALGCSMLGDGDLYDHGIRDADLCATGLHITINGFTISFPKEEKLSDV